ncbi:MAG: acetyl-CoA decarbonylase/synthase complex subunit delta [Coriobacteriales bacterium]|nr:acetyl-CoA decarbonylase/synthase complex subunit delta [Coriobacteriales bacterium]
MPFKHNPQVFSSSIGETVLGTGEKALTLGGENVWSLYSFDGAVKNPPAVGIEFSDQGPDRSLPGVAAAYEGAETLAELAKKAEQVPGVQFVAFRLAGSDPNGDNESVADSVAKVKEVADAISLPLVVTGSNNIDKDAELLPKVAEALQGKNALLLNAKEENYKGIAVAAVTAYGQKVSGESAVDINLAKQLNVLFSQLGIKNENLVENLGQGVVGYGFEYIISTVERVKLAALTQNDAALQIPVISPISTEAWTVKESLATEEEIPEWGSREERGIGLEVSTAVASIAAGSNAVILMHPASVATVSKLIAELV